MTGAPDIVADIVADIVVIGLSLSSSWGNGHATTYRALLRGLAGRGHRILFLERDVPWYAAHRDLPDPDFCELALYRSVEELEHRFTGAIAGAETVVVGSYVPDGVAVIDAVLTAAQGVVAFYDIDTPVTLAALDRGEEVYLAPRQIPGFDLYLSFTGGPLLDRLGRRYGARRPLPLYCAVDETRYRPSDQPLKWQLGYLGTYSADRQLKLERLLFEVAQHLPEHRFVVAGAQYPDDLVWPANVDRLDHVPPSAHPAFFGAQRFTLNLTRADMVAAGWSPSVRLFEAAACGTPIISDRWSGLAELLPEPEAILTAEDTDEMVAILTRLDEVDRRLIAARARAIVTACHTGDARAREFDSYVTAARAKRPPHPRAPAPAGLGTS